mgnify:CR=1 FL=1
MFFQQQDTPQEIDFNPGIIIERLDNWLDGLVRLLPNIAVAIVLMVIFYFIARLVKRIIINRTAKSGRENLGTVAGGFVKSVILVAGFLLAATIVIPTLKPGDLIAGLGVSSVAIGFAFQDILQNWLAGLLILLRQPFEVDDQIVVNGFEGSVERIETRATIIKQYNNERVVIPNSDIYTNAVKVKTANAIIRSQYDIGVGYGDDMQEAVDVIRKAMKGIEGVDATREVEVLPWDLAASWVTIRIRWWTDSQRSSVVKVHARVMQQVKTALDAAKIDMPYDTQVHLFHDQTEETDGDRTAQREGWPGDKNDANPRPKWQAERELSKEEKKAIVKDQIEG